MDFYWRVKNIPELRDVPRKDQREWWRAAVAHSRTTRFKLATVVVFMALLTAISQFVRYEHWSFVAHAVIAGMVTGLCALFLEYKFQQPRARQWLRAHFAEDRAKRAG